MFQSLPRSEDIYVNTRRRRNFGQTAHETAEQTAQRVV